MSGALLGNRYEFVRLLGQGGMGAVHEAVDRVTGARVAIKVINDRWLGSDKDTVRRFRREAKVAAAIQSPHIVRNIDSGQDEITGQIYIVMELLQGEDLQRCINRIGPLQPDVALRIGAQALRGLVEAHRSRVIHRDIKPANLFLAHDDDGEVVVKLLDFGIAKIKAEPGEAGPGHTTGLTSTSNFLGSPLYASPEQVDSSKDVDEQADVWSLGASLYCALTGRAPHQHISAIVKLIFAICSTPAAPITEKAPWVSPAIAEAVHRALEIEREDRTPSAAAMLEALEALLPDGARIHREMLVGPTDEERSAREESAPKEPALAPRDDVAANEEAKDEAPSSEKDVAPNPTPAARRTIAAALALALLVAGAFVASRRPESESSAGGHPVRGEPEGLSSTSSPNDRLPEDLRRVSLHVSPESASVEVDGAGAKVERGTVEIAGRLGSAHRVRVFEKNAEIERDVIIAEMGAVPPLLALPTPPISAPSASVVEARPERPTPPRATTADEAKAGAAPPAEKPKAAPPAPSPPPTPSPSPTPSKPEDVLMPSE